MKAEECVLEATVCVSDDARSSSLGGNVGFDEVEFGRRNGGVRHSV